MNQMREDVREDMRFRILSLLQDNPELSQRDLAHKLGISVGSLHYVLSALIDKGLVKLGNFSNSKDRRRYAYILTPRGMREKSAIAARFLKRKLAEYEALKHEIAALQDQIDLEQGKGRSPDTPHFKER